MKQAICVRLDHGWIAGTNSSNKPPWLRIGQCYILIRHLSEKWRSKCSLKLPLAQHGLLGISSSGAPTPAVAFHSPAFCWKTWGFQAHQNGDSGTLPTCHSSWAVSLEFWKSAGTILWKSHWRHYTAVFKVKILSCQPKSFAPTSL